MTDTRTLCKGDVILSRRHGGFVRFSHWQTEPVSYGPESQVTGTARFARVTDRNSGRELSGLVPEGELEVA